MFRVLQEQIDSHIKRFGSDPEFYIRALVTKERFIKRLCDEIDTLKAERMLFEQENAKHQQQRNALRVSLEDALKENARLKAQLHKKDREIRLVKVERDREKFSRELYYSLYTFWSKEAVALKTQLKSQSSSTATGSDTRVPAGGTLSLEQLIEGHAESIRQSVEGFPLWVQELKVKEQLGFFEPILEDYPECPKTC